jgi:hypothetical protein
MPYRIRLSRPRRTAHRALVRRRPIALGARLVHRTALFSAPGGQRIATLGLYTDFGSPRLLSVVRRRGAWLAVSVPEAPVGRVGWVAARTVRLFAVSYVVRVSLKRRELVVQRNGRVTERVRVGIGRAMSPTPLGRFAVTDKLVMRGPSVYGCCVLVLSGRQTRLPASWTGGDRLAIHGTGEGGTIGTAVTLGCLRAAAGDLWRLVHTVPIATPVIVDA